jgi:hypothetical protein
MIMQQWEYLDVYIEPDGFWSDSSGRTGQLLATPVPGLRPNIPLRGTLLNELGVEGWELVSIVDVTSTPRYYCFKRPKV